MDRSTPQRDPPTRLRGGWILKQILGRALLPHHALRWLRRRWTHRRVPTVHGDAQLLLYNRMLPGDFLHYGYFDDPGTPAETISFDALRRAQHRYAEQLLDRIGRPGEPVLDAGSGMGGMLGILQADGCDVTGLTPDRFQVEHIRSRYPNVPVLHCRFEDMLAPGTSRGFRARFGTVIHSESIQYMEPRGVFAVMSEILAPGGTWIVADYFRGANPGAAGRTANRDRSGWRLDRFRRQLAENGFEIADETDITANVLPTLGFAHLLANRIGLPVLDFATDKLRAKTPVVYYVVENVAERVRAAARRSTSVIDPVAFAARKRYMLMTIRRS